MNRLKLITLILLTFTLNVCAQNYIIRQDSLRASEAATKLHLKNAIKDSLDANARGWQTEAQVRQIAGDSSQVAETRAKNYTDTQFNNNPNGKTIPIFDTECSPQPSDTSGNLKFNRTSSVLYTLFASLYTTNNNASWFAPISGSSVIDKGTTIMGLTMHSSVTSIIDPEYGTPLSNYRNSGKNLVQYFVERDYFGNLRTGTWDIGAINGN